MKQSSRILVSLLLCMICFFGFVACRESVTPDTPDVLYPMVRINGVVYSLSATKLDAEPQESEYAGQIASIVSITEVPMQDNEANFPCLNEPYVITDDGIALPYNGEWTLFRVDPGNE